MPSLMSGTRDVLAFFRHDRLAFYFDLTCEITVGVGLRPAIEASVHALASITAHSVSAVRRFVEMRAEWVPEQTPYAKPFARRASVWKRLRSSSLAGA